LKLEINPNLLMKKILLIQTGGTIAMDLSDRAGGEGRPELNPDRWSEALAREVPELSEIADTEVEQLFYEDSSDIHPDHWARLIGLIETKYERYDGFVILHGTDTMAYTASALSFGLQNLGKPVIMTGSQVPMRSIRSDARRNLVNAIEMATMPLNEVAICFNDFIYRGNRSTKMSIGDFDAFASPNFPPLAEIGLHIEVNVEYSRPEGPLETFAGFDDRLFLLKIFPGMNPSFLDGLDLKHLRAVVIEAFGTGNFPVKGELSLLPFLERCIERELLIVITSQAPYDAVDLSQYASGRKALELGALSAGDMTTEATLTKLMHLLARDEGDERVRERFGKSIAGEITV